MMFISVDLPDPDGPTIATNSLRLIERSTLRSASTFTAPVSYTLRTPARAMLAPSPSRRCPPLLPFFPLPTIATPSLEPQRLGGLHRDRPPRREVPGQQADQAQERDRRDRDRDRDRRRAEDLHRLALGVRLHRGQDLHDGHPHPDADDAAGDRQRQRLEDDRARDVDTTRAERHLDADLARPVRDRGEHDVGDADPADDQGERADHPEDASRPIMIASNLLASSIVSQN